MSGAIRRSHESKKRVRSATAFGQCNRNRLLRQSKVLFARLTPGPLMGVNDSRPVVEGPVTTGHCLMQTAWASRISCDARDGTRPRPCENSFLRR